MDIAVAAASQQGAAPDAVALDYLVRESRPWTAYAQVSNTGTDATNEWRQRIGFVHRQLTGRDDTFTFDAVTASFEDTWGGLVSYEAPLPGTTLAKLKAFGTFNEYVASDIGLPGQDLEGTTGTYGGEFIVTAYQNRSLFVEPFFGLVGKQYEVINDLAGTESDVSLFLGTAGVRVEDRRPTRSLFGELAVDWTFDGGDANDLPGLGRLRVEDNWARLRWNTSASFFLEPLLFNDSWSDPTSSLATLGHEVVVSFRGQSAFDSRLIPQEQGVVGGAYSVRGYPESVVAGDTVFIASAEYRAHLPAILGMAEAGSSGESFRWRRDRPYGQADWDLVLAGFVDLGQTIANDPEANEFDETLVGAGFGVGLDIKRNVSVRADWGFALSDLDSGRASSGDSEIHFVATIAY
ncbi:MAG: ShlB/FhaC/HecB family hemolysin secretion/activation protein [Planctomycetota bacterium]